MRGRWSASQFLSLLRAGLFIAWATLLYRLIHTGQFAQYVHPNFAFHSLFAIAAYAMFAASQLWRSLQRGAEPARSRIAGHLLVLAPVLIGLAVPPVILGADVVEKRGINLGPRGAGAAPVLSDGRLIITDENFASIIPRLYAEPAGYAGREVTLTGFVVKVDTLKPDEFFLARLVVTCHVAHAMPDGLVIRTPDAAMLPADTWMEVHGILTAGEHLGQPVPKAQPTAMRVIAPLKTPYILAGI